MSNTLIALSLFVLLGAASACRKQKTQAPPDYDGVRQRSEQSHGSLDAQD